MSSNLLERILDRIDNLVNEMSEIKVILAKQEAAIEEHIYRTNLLEESVEALRKEVEPVKKHVTYVEIALKLVGGIAVLVGLFESIKSLFGK